MSKTEWVQVYPGNGLPPMTHDAWLDSYDVSFNALDTLLYNVKELFRANETPVPEVGSAIVRFSPKGVEVHYRHVLTPAEAVQQERNNLKALISQAIGMLPKDEGVQLKSDEVERLRWLLKQADAS